MQNRRARNIFNQIVFLGPALLFFIVIVVIPFFLGMMYAFTDWNGISDKVNFVGIKNFEHIFTDVRFWTNFWFSIRYTFCYVIIVNLVAFILANLLTVPIRFRNLFRSIFFIPNVVSGLLLGFIWQFIFINVFPDIAEITNLGIFGLPWLGSASTAFWGLIIVSVWQSAGYIMVIYIAGMSNIPQELLEAAKTDGATAWQVLRNIKVPLIMPSITVSLFITMSWALKMFDLNLSLTNGGPFNSSVSVALDIFMEAFRKNHYGFGAAKALLFTILVAVVTFMQVRTTQKREVEL